MELKQVNPKLIEQSILSVVQSFQGVKSIDLLVNLCHGLLNEGYKIDGDEVSGLIDKMVDAGMIIEVEYTLPAMPYRVKSFLLPKGTTFAIRELKGSPVLPNPPQPPQGNKDIPKYTGATVV